MQYTQEETVSTHSFVSQQPDVIPTQRDSVQSDTFEEPLAPPPAFSGNGENGDAAESVPEIVQSVPAQTVHEEEIYSNMPQEEQIYSNIDVMQQQEIANHAQPEEAAVINPAALTGNEDYNLSEYIEDTKIQAIALYDYQASAEDEISFDPNDIITHIEMVRVILPFISENEYTFKAISFNFENKFCKYIHRLMKDGGVDCAKIDMDCSRPIMFKFKSNIETFFIWQ